MNKASTLAGSGSVQVGDFTVDLVRELLIDKRGNSVALRPRAWLVLRELAHHAGQLVTKNELMDTVWADCVVTEDSLVQAVGDVRRALGETGRQALRTLPRRGYMLIGTVGPSDGEPRTAQSQSLGDRLGAAATRRFVGREAELGVLREAISSTDPLKPLFFLHGPGGIGKSSLLAQLRSEALQTGVPLTTFDASGLPATPEGIVGALSRTFGNRDGANGLPEQVTSWLGSARHVLVIDNFDDLQPAVSWLRDVLLPMLPASTTIVLAGRQAPDSHWTAHPLWGESMSIVALQTLSGHESARLMGAHGVPGPLIATATALCHGHPLALVLLAGEVRRSGRVPPELGADLVRELARRCLSQVPTALHRTALRLCARSRTTTLALLADVTGAADAPMLFDWLAEQSYISADDNGLRPHDLVREVIDEDLRWRDPQESRALQHAISLHLFARLQREDVAHAAFELQYLERHSPLMQRFFDFAAMGSITVGPAVPDDGPSIDHLRDEALPDSERRIFDYWRQHSSTRLLVARRRHGAVCGVTMILSLENMDETSDAIDPVVARVRRVLADLPPTAGAQATVSMLSRFTLPEGGRRALNPAMNALQISHFMQWATEPGLRFWVIVASHPDVFAPLLEGTGFARLPGCDLETDGLPLGCFMHDWQLDPWIDWRDRITHQGAFRGSA